MAATILSLGAIVICCPSTQVVLKRSNPHHGGTLHLFFHPEMGAPNVSMQLQWECSYATIWSHGVWISICVELQHTRDSNERLPHLFVPNLKKNIILTKWFYCYLSLSLTLRSSLAPCSLRCPVREFAFVQQ